MRRSAALQAQFGRALAELHLGRAAIDHHEAQLGIDLDNLQLIRIRLKPGQELYAEAGKILMLSRMTRSKNESA